MPTRSLLVTSLALLCLAAPAYAATFSVSDLSGWSLSQTGMLFWDSTPPNSRQMSLAEYRATAIRYTHELQSVPLFAANGEPGRPIVENTPEEVALRNVQIGSYDAYTRFFAPDGHQWYSSHAGYTISLVASIFLDVGDVFAGFAQFSTVDFPPYGDYGCLAIDDSEVWRRTIADVVTIGFPYNRIVDDSWNYWSFEATEAREHTVRLSVYGDDLFDSTAKLRSVPDGGTTAALFAGSLLVLFLARRKHRCCAMG